jgi:hypothetical protein
MVMAIDNSRPCSASSSFAFGLSDEVERLFKKVTGRERVGMSESKIKDLVLSHREAVQELQKSQTEAMTRLLLENSESLSAVFTSSAERSSELEAEVAELIVEKERLRLTLEAQNELLRMANIDDVETGGTGSFGGLNPGAKASTINNNAFGDLRLEGASTKSPPPLSQLRVAATDTAAPVARPQVHHTAKPPDIRRPGSPTSAFHRTNGVSATKKQEPRGLRPVSAQTPDVANVMKGPSGDAPVMPGAVDDDAGSELDVDDYEQAEPVKPRVSQSEKRRSLCQMVSRESKLIDDDEFEIFKPSKRVFGDDANTMKTRLQEALLKPQYDVVDFYHTEGRCQMIARSQLFENITLFVIAINSLWIAHDSDVNTATVLNQASTYIIVFEQLFCIFFACELAIRFLAFQAKRNCLKDAWFVFDSSLVFLMVMETWVVFIAILVAGPGLELPTSGPTRSLKLLKLARIARMVRLLRAAPELMIMIKAMRAALRGVIFAFILLVAMVYVFAILLRQLTAGEDYGNEFFPNVPCSMATLLLDGAFPDQKDLIYGVGGGCPENLAAAMSADPHTLSRMLYGSIIVLYLIFASLTCLNMLVGILCDVVSAVSSFEREEMLLSHVRDCLWGLLESVGIDPETDMINRETFEDLLAKKQAIITLHELGVDVIGLVEQLDFIFADSDDLNFGDFFDLILKLRGTNHATVKDMVDLRKLIRNESDRLEADFLRILPAVSRSVRKATTSNTISSGSYAGDRKNTTTTTETTVSEVTEAKVVKFEASDAGYTSEE